jgi:hypothetical protein
VGVSIYVKCVFRSVDLITELLVCVNKRKYDKCKKGSYCYTERNGVNIFQFFRPIFPSISHILGIGMLDFSALNIPKTFSDLGSSSTLVLC